MSNKLSIKTKSEIRKANTLLETQQVIFTKVFDIIRRSLWSVFSYNDHNFNKELIVYFKETFAKIDITDINQANEFLKELESHTIVSTPSSRWMNKEDDPHGAIYNCERSRLTLGNHTDDELANEVFIHGNSTPDFKKVVNGTARMPIVYLEAAKDRIRWLSRSLEKEIKKNQELTDKLNKIESTQSN